MKKEYVAESKKKMNAKEAKGIVNDIVGLIDWENHLPALKEVVETNIKGILTEVKLNKLTNVIISHAQELAKDKF